MTPGTPLNNELIYLDYASTTPVDPRVATALAASLMDDGALANPSSAHHAGRRSKARVQAATEQLAVLLGCSPAELVWTSGATEADNLAIIGSAQYRADRGRHLITMTTEHKAVTDAFRVLEARGFDVTWLEPTADGLLDIERLDRELRDDTQLVSIMHVNNETGVTQDIDAIGSICRERDVLFHVDAAQSAGKLPINLSRLPVDLMSVTAHKFYGPKGIGALYVADRPGCHVEPLLFGGGQQRGLRPGTLPVPLIIAMGVTAEIAAAERETDLRHAANLRRRLIRALDDIDGLILNGHAERHYPGILNVSLADIDGESLLLALEPLCVATGSACNSRSQEPSYVLRALGRDDDQAQGAIRFSFGRGTRVGDIDAAASIYRRAVDKLRALAPVA